MEQKETAPDDERKKKALAASVAVFGTSLLLVGFAGPVLVRHFRSHLQALQLPATQNGSTNTRKNSLLSLTEAFRQPPSTIKFERNIDLDGRNIFAAGNQHLENQENADDAFDPGFYAAKALGIATAITLSVFGGGLATFAYKTGADSPKSLAVNMGRSLQEYYNTSIYTRLPDAAKPKERPQTKEDVELEKSVETWLLENK